MQWNKKQNELDYHNKHSNIMFNWDEAPTIHGREVFKLADSDSHGSFHLPAAICFFLLVQFAMIGWEFTVKMQNQQVQLNTSLCSLLGKVKPDCFVETYASSTVTCLGKI